MPRADIARIDLVVVEVLAIEQPRLVADQAVLAHPHRIEFDLEFHVLGDREQRAADLLDQYFARFVDRVDIGSVAVALLRQLLHQRVVVVAHAEAEAGKRDPTLPLARDKVFQLVRIGDPNVEVAVRRQDHAIDAVLLEVRARQLIGLPDALRACRRSARCQVIECRQDLALVRPRGRFQHHARITGIDHDRHPVLSIELVYEHAHRLLHQRQLVRLIHRARYVEQENEVRSRSLVALNVEALDPDMHDLRVGVPRRLIDRNRRPERLRAVLGQSVRVVEVVDHLLDPDRICRRQRAVVQKLPHDRVRRRIHIGGERRHRLLARKLHRVRLRVRKLVADVGRDHRRVRRGRLHRGRRRNGVGSSHLFPNRTIDDFVLLGRGSSRHGSRTVLGVGLSLILPLVAPGQHERADKQRRNRRGCRQRLPEKNVGCGLVRAHWLSLLKGRKRKLGLNCAPGGARSWQSCGQDGRRRDAAAICATCCSCRRACCSRSQALLFPAGCARSRRRSGACRYRSSAVQASWQA